jgi:hypothetical protein
MAKHEYVYISAITGRFVSIVHYRANPNTTVRMRVDPVKPKRKVGRWRLRKRAGKK